MEVNLKGNKTRTKGNDNNKPAPLRTTSEDHRDDDGLIIAISRVSAAISGLGNLEAILNIGLETALDYLQGEAGGVMLVDEANEYLSYRVTRGLSDRYTSEMHMKMGEGVAGKVAQSGKAALLDDISGEQNATRPDLINFEGLRSFVSVPLKIKEKTLGVMNIASQRPRTFSRRDIYVCMSIADQLSTAVEQVKLNERLRKGRERYRQLARRVIVAQEKERKKIARDLHDETSQILAGLSLNLQALTEMAEGMDIKDGQFMDILNKSHNLTVQVHSEVSRIIADLRPTQLDTLGLVAAVRQYVNNIVVSRGIEVHFDMEPINKKLFPEEELSLFRLVQGAVGNIIQHSEAKNVYIVLKQQDDNLVVSISDDGKGFEIDRLTEMREIGRGYGLLNMKERMILIGATCNVQTEPGEGTTVKAFLPLAGKPAAGKDI